MADNAFHPLVVGENFEAWREFRIIIDFYRKGLYQRDRFTGIFSPKFQLKSLISGDEFIDFVRRNDDADVCLFNPYPSTNFLSFNVWMHGEAFHPGLTSKAQALLDICGIGWDIASVPRHTASTLCYSNFWVGTPGFWDMYVGMILDPIARFLEENPEHPVAIDVLQATTHYTSAPFLPFIVERLFTTFLSINPQIKVVAHEAPYVNIMMYCQTEFERDIVREMAPWVRAADASGSFSDELICMQKLLCSLYQRYVIEYFAHHPHPHTGAVMQLPD
ncbi:hypothetical protein C9I57_12910 [Trinickia symbiotica]|uniref:Uncharacterized protein n=1 Tax=Trinickia symbiotica TaxID=863227 RepID=A0A2T3XW20_9BURK|nr:hypothetical protein C9I57_12910 [Trinickia symbiotica]